MNLSEPEETYLTVAEVAGILKLNQQTVRNWIEAGSLPAYHVGRRVRVRREDFDALIERGASTGGARPASAGPSIWDGENPAPQIPDA